MPAAVRSGPNLLAGLTSVKPTPQAMSVHPATRKATPVPAEVPANENDASLRATCSENRPSAIPEAETATSIAFRAMRQS
jgi:hypothetical protein